MPNYGRGHYAVTRDLFVKPPKNDSRIHFVGSLELARVRIRVRIRIRIRVKGLKLVICHVVSHPGT
jgi:hypothetical protein